MSASSSHLNIAAPMVAPHNSCPGAPIPDCYGQTRIVSLPRDPLCIFAYWEITFETIQHVQAQFGAHVFSESTAVLRLHEVEENSRKILSFLDIPISIDAGRWYIHLPKEGGLWQVEIGLKLKNGDFIRLAASDFVRAPSLCDTSDCPQDWASVQEWAKKFFLGSFAGGSSEKFPLWMQQRELFKNRSSWNNAQQNASTPIKKESSL